MVKLFVKPCNAAWLHSTTEDRLGSCMVRQLEMVRTADLAKIFDIVALEYAAVFQTDTICCEQSLDIHLL